MLKNALCVVMAAFLAMGCAPVQEDLIKGSWKGVAILEDGAPLEVDPTVINMSFGDDHSYTYSSTLNYRESGTYYVDSKYLYTTDTLNQATTEKAVEIVGLTTDSLILKMNEEGRERLLKMIRAKN
ncbi:MAG: hypothetical protein KDD02_00730 [Phaeodactylibacter sp.]|nr:hypothetical protein [Phaeodactylibacter sp.]MCB9303935.1 hypothetical protein [Lewinellaceae bacterium]